VFSRMLEVGIIVLTVVFFYALDRYAVGVMRL
jgi:hypothetical protein